VLKICQSHTPILKILFLVGLGFDYRLQACKAGALLLEPQLQGPHPQDLRKLPSAPFITLPMTLSMGHLAQSSALLYVAILERGLGGLGDYSADWRSWCHGGGSSMGLVTVVVVLLPEHCTVRNS
jgi:hypothetical protein